MKYAFSRDAVADQSEALKLVSEHLHERLQVEFSLLTR